MLVVAQVPVGGRCYVALHCLDGVIVYGEVGELGELENLWVLVGSCSFCDVLDSMGYVISRICGPTTGSQALSGSRGRGPRGNRNGERTTTQE